MSGPLVSIILATHNRRDVVLHTLARLESCGLDPSQREIFVVDNASSDGTADAAAGMPGVHVIRNRRNFGSCAKALAIDRSRAPLTVFLDDDSTPRPGCLERMVRHFKERPELGAAAFTVHLPDGSQECSALPHVFVGCGVGFRTSALRQVGGLDATYFMQAEEYDLSFRLLRAGWRVEVFADLQVDHLKTPCARRSERTTFYDTRNNLRVIAAHLRGDAATIYREDWLLRYRWLAESAGQCDAYRRGVWSGRVHGWRDRLRSGGGLSSEAFESVFCWRLIAGRMKALAATGVRRIILADWGKNAYAFVRGASLAGLLVKAIADNRFAAQGRAYRGIPILKTEEVFRRPYDAVVVANTSYVHAGIAAAELAGRGPIHNWFPLPAPPSLGAAGAAPVLASAGGAVACDFERAD
ncbi:MAG: glycosyltransferase [Planctomycetes bacterium]|nr:glycosyltransferase [Planctomycetota bacterium]